MSSATLTACRYDGHSLQALRIADGSWFREFTSLIFDIRTNRLLAISQVSIERFVRAGLLCINPSRSVNTYNLDSTS